AVVLVSRLDDDRRGARLLDLRLVVAREIPDLDAGLVGLRPHRPLDLEGHAQRRAHAQRADRHPPHAAEEHQAASASSASISTCGTYASTCVAPSSSGPGSRGRARPSSTIRSPGGRPSSAPRRCVSKKRLTTSAMEPTSSSPALVRSVRY